MTRSTIGPLHAATPPARREDAAIVAILRLSRDRRIAAAVEQARALLATCGAAARPDLEACTALVEWRAAADAGRIDEALPEAIAAIRRLEASGHGPQLAWVFSTIGLALGQIGDFESGLEWCQRGIEGAEQNRDRRQLVIAWCNKGIVFGYANELGRAVEHFRRVLELCGDDPEITAVMALGNLSYCRILEAERSDTPGARRNALAAEAVDFAAAALARVDALPEADAHLAAHARGEALSNKASALCLLGRLAEAEAVFRAGLALSRRYPQTEVELAVGYARLLLDTGRDARAARLLDRAEARARGTLVDQSLDRILRLRISLARRRGRNADADVLWEVRLRLAGKRYRDRLEKVRHYEQIRAQAAELATELDQKQTELKLLEQKLELAARLQEERLLRERDRSRMDERMRLVRDMHDGFGSQLASARILVERGEMRQADLARTLDECLADLHLFVDVIGNDDRSLADALADYRFRIQRRLEGMPFQVAWKVDLDEAPAMPGTAILQVMRIVQEALNNALRHARARHVRIEGARTPSGDVCVRVVDDGTGIPPDAAGGRGMGNMRRRALEIGARLEFLPAHPGAIVSLVVPAPGPAGRSG